VYEWDYETIPGNVTEVVQFLDLLVNATCGFISDTDMTHWQRIHLYICPVDYIFIRMERKAYLSDIS
jgi:hypothetical protein